MPRLLYGLLCVSLLAATLGCEEDILLVDRTDKAFTMYGILNPRMDTQYVHVFPIEGSLEPAPVQPLDARFTSTNTTTGETLTWSDSLITDPDGHAGHVFWAPFRAAHDQTYELVLESTTRGESSVSVTVPPEVRPLLQPYEPTDGPVFSNVRLEGPAPRLLKVELQVWGRTIEGYEGVTPIFLDKKLHLAYDDRLEKTADGWLVPVDLDEVYALLFDAITEELPPDVVQSRGIQLALLTLNIIVANEAWNPPDVQLDPLALAHPNVLTNVENGYGFVGSGFTITHSWRPDHRAREEAGFIDPT